MHLQHRKNTCPALSRSHLSPVRSLRWLKNIDYKDGITRQQLHNCAGTLAVVFSIIPSFILCKVGPRGKVPQNCFLGIFAIDTNRQSWNSCPRSCHHDRRSHQCRRHLRSNECWRHLRSHHCRSSHHARGSHHARTTHWRHAGHRCVLIISHHDGHCCQCAGQRKTKRLLLLYWQARFYSTFSARSFRLLSFYCSGERKGTVVKSILV